MIITIEDTVGFAPNVGVLILEEVGGICPHRLHEMISLAKIHIQDEILVDCCCGGAGPLAKFEQINGSRMDFGFYLDFKFQIEADEIARIRTRNEFNRMRPTLLDEMLKSGMTYICAEFGCVVCNRLTIDHITPIHRGGTNEISNLQFLCRSHNSKKGTK